MHYPCKKVLSSTAKYPAMCHLSGGSNFHAQIYHIHNFHLQSPHFLPLCRILDRSKMCSMNLLYLLAVSALLSAINCTKINPDTFGEGTCQYPDCAPQLPPPSTYQPYASPPPPAPISPPPAPTGYPPYGVTPPPPVYPENCPPPPAPQGYSTSDQQPDFSPPSPPPSLYTYLNDTWISAASFPAELPSVFNLCGVIYILFLFAALRMFN